MRQLSILILLAGSVALQGQNLLDEQGRKTGPWKVDYPSGRTLYKATFHEGNPVGEMVRYYESGAVRARMMFESPEERSYTRLYYENGRLAAEGWYVRQAKDSVWTYYSELDGTVRIREPYEDGNLHGTVLNYYPDGTVSEEVNWELNVKRGPWKQYYEDGSLRLGSQYDNDMLNGPYEVYSDDSTIMIRGAYLNDNSDGTWRFYDEEGAEAYTIEYRNGKVMDREKYDQIMQDTLLRYRMILEQDSVQQF